MKITSAEFIGATSDGRSPPETGLPEAAFAGRSNVGKSSLINTLTSRKKLARTSQNPGHTRQINFFSINGKYCLADLPGYGYAKVSKKERDRWRSMLERYFKSREQLRAVVLIMDIRREPREDEFDLIGLLTGAGIGLILVATKSDKLKGNKLNKARADLARAFGISAEDVVLFSSQTGKGRDELWKRIARVLDQ